MPDAGRPTAEALLAEYAATNQAYLHYDAFSWQVGSVLLAGVFVFWGFLLQAQPSGALFAVSGLLVTLIMSTWALYADHNRQIYLQKLDRLHEIERELGLKQHLRWISGDCRTFGPKGHTLDFAVYVVSCLGGPLIQWLLGDPAILTSATSVLAVLFIRAWILRNERRLKRHREGRREPAATG